MGASKEHDMYRDHGPLSDRRAQPYCEAPRFTITPDNRASRLAYEAAMHIETMRIEASRLEYVAERLAAQAATYEQLEDVKNAARDCERALAAVIAKLCGEVV